MLLHTGHQHYASYVASAGQMADAHGGLCGVEEAEGLSSRHMRGSGQGLVYVPHVPHVPVYVYMSSLER